MRPNPTCTCEHPDPSGSLNGGAEVCLNCGGTLIEPEVEVEGCPDCGKDTITEDESGVHCSDLRCGWRE